MNDELEIELFDDAVVVALALSTVAEGIEPRAAVKRRLMAAIANEIHSDAPPLPPGFSVRRSTDDGWMPHPVPGIRMKVLSVNRDRDYATLLLDVSPGTRFPAHHHSGPEECYVLSGSLYTCGRRLAPGDFVHADAGTDHGELWTDEGCRVLLVVPVDEHLDAPAH